MLLTKSVYYRSPRPCCCFFALSAMQEGCVAPIPNPSLARGDCDLLSTSSEEEEELEVSLPIESPSLKETTAAKCRNDWKDRMHHYGAVYNIMTGNPTTAPKPLAAAEHHATMETANLVDYCEQLHHCSTKDVDICPIQPEFEYGSYYDIEVTETNNWILQTSETALVDLTTLDIQSAFAAALNSRRLLVWLIGVEADGQITGCALNRTQRDIFQQAFDFSIATEFIPELKPSLVNLRFLKVCNGDMERFLIELSTTCTTKEVFQLSSGRFFMCKNDKLERVPDLNTVYQRMKRSCIVKDDPSTLSGEETFTSVTRDIACISIGVLAGYCLKKFL